MRRRPALIVPALMVALSLVAPSLRAAGNTNQLPALPTPLGQDASKADQLRALLQLEALQMRGRRHGPVRGIDNPIINAGPSFDAGNSIAPEPPAVDSKAGRKSAAQKRAEARKLKEERKRAAQEHSGKKKLKADKPPKPDKAPKLAKEMAKPAGKAKPKPDEE